MSGAPTASTNAVSILAVLIGLGLAAGAAGLRLEAPGPPWHWPAALAVPLLAAAARGAWPRARLVGMVAGVPWAMAALAALALLAAPLAIWPSGGDAPGWLGACGLAHPLANPGFAVAWLAVSANLAMSVAGRMFGSRSQAPFLAGWGAWMVHLGLLVALIGGTAAAGALLRGRVVLTIDEPAVATVQLDRGGGAALPAGLQLRAFILDHFPPRFALERGGATLGGEVLLAPAACESVGGWTVRVEEFLPKAAVLEGQAPCLFMMEGANPALRVRASGPAGTASGWLHAPSRYGPALTVALPDGSLLGLQPPRPRRYAARIVIDGREQEVAVNHPLRLAGWDLYLAGYDEAAGAASRRVDLEAIEDRALPAVYLGLALLLLGAAAVGLAGGRRGGGR